MKTIKNQFNSYRMTYGIASQDTTKFKDYARIDCLLRNKKVGQILFGSVIAPGNNGGLVNNKEIHLYFPLSHFSNIIEILKSSGREPLALYLEIEEETNNAHIGGITTEE
jgi:hypothetical protein